MRNYSAGLWTALLLVSLGPITGQSNELAALDLETFEGKVLVVDFWASWCVPCRRSFPWLNDMQSKYGPQGLVIIGVNLDNDLEAATEFLKEYPPDFQIYYDHDRKLAEQFDVIAMPSSYLIGRNGSIVHRHFGFKVRQQAEYEAGIVAALTKEGEVQ